MSNYNINNEAIAINGFTPGWSSISLSIGGYVFKNISAISYTESLDIQPVMGKGSKAVAYGVGNFSYNGSITIRKEELDTFRRSLAAAAKNSILESEPTSILVLYRNVDGISIQSDKLIGCMFQSVDISSSQGDLQIDINIPFVFCDLKSSII